MCVCVCIHVKVVRHLLCNCWGCFFGGGGLTLKHCEYVCVSVFMKQSVCGVRQRQVPLKMRTRLLYLTDSCKEQSLNSSLILLRPYFLSYPHILSQNLWDTINHNIICQFRCVVNQLFHLATKFWHDFKVVLINTILKKQWLCNVSDTAAMTGRDTVPPLSFTSSSLDQICEIF